MTEPDLSYIDAIVAQIGGQPEKVIPILQAIQQQYRYLPQPALQRVCEITGITPASIAGIATFYPQFRHQPVGQYIIRVCHGTACHVKGAESIQDALRRNLRISSHQDTDPDNLFTIEKVACLGCCTLAPAVQIENITYGHLTPESVSSILNDFLTLQSQKPATTAKKTKEISLGTGGEIRIGLGSCCIAKGSEQVFHAFERAIGKMQVPIKIKRVGCVGMCYQTPMAEVIDSQGQSSTYARITADDAEAIVHRHFKPPHVTRRLRESISTALDNLLSDQNWQPVTRYSMHVRDEPVQEFLGRQKHLATEHFGHIDPLDLDEYLKNEGFTALQKCLRELSPQQILEQIRISDLRGRGGAGYHSALKWAAVQQAPSGKKYVICNGDEGDPGAFMDRMLLESFPYRIIEGLLIAAYTVGADEGYFYIRSEYPLAVKRVREALKLCQEKGYVGQNILGSGFSCTLQIMEGAGAFVCGEETALLASLEGRRGMPRLRPPYPAEKGLWNRPTLINNVESISLVPWIIRNGAEQFATLGNEHSKGTKVFALAGKVVRGGLIEVPMGITIREIVEHIGGGIAGHKKFKAVQIGGPSGGCIPASLAHVTVDYEALVHVGAIMGSGGLVVLDESDCMVDIARFFLEFTQNQSCGRCTLCRIGTRRMLDILNRLCQGKAQPNDLAELEHLAHSVKKGSLCGLGKTAPNPVLSTLKYFRDEYEAHLQKRCPAGRCKALITYSITDDCIGCTLCAQHCPADAIAMTPYEKHEIDPEKCVRCGTCKNICPVHAVEVK